MPAINIVGQTTTAAQTVSVTAAPTSAGIAYVNSRASSSVTIVNTSPAGQDNDVQYQLNATGWKRLGRSEGVTLVANVAADTLYFRRNGADTGTVEVSMESVPVINAGSTPLPALSQDTTSIFTGDEPKAALDVLALKDYRPFCEISPGVYLLTNAANGNFSKQICVFTGNIVTGIGTYNTRAEFNWNDSTAAQGLYKNDGTTIISGTNSYVQQVWRLSSGAFVMLSLANDTFRYLHRIASNYQCGTSGNNRAASLHVGALTANGAGTSEKIHALHQRSLCEVKVGASKFLLFAEYNTAGVARVSGSTNDQCIVWRSDDDGVSWTKFLEWNTDGSHLFSHFHAVIQNPYTGIVYLLCGDVGNENAVISWDGVSTAPGTVAGVNPTLAQIAAKPGWGITYGDERKRYGDLAFSPDGRVFGLPDSDTNPAFASTGFNAFVGCTVDSSLRFVAGGLPFTRQNDICPLIVLRTRSGVYVYGCLRTQGAATVNEPYMHFWTSVDGVNWVLAAKIKNFNAASANMLEWYEDSQGNLIGGTTNGRGGSFGGASRTSSCVIMRVNLQYGMPTLVIRDT